MSVQTEIPEEDPPSSSLPRWYGKFRQKKAVGGRAGRRAGGAQRRCIGSVAASSFPLQWLACGFQRNRNISVIMAYVCLSLMKNISGRKSLFSAKFVRLNTFGIRTNFFLSDFLTETLSVASPCLSVSFPPSLSLLAVFPCP